MDTSALLPGVMLRTVILTPPPVLRFPILPTNAVLYEEFEFNIAYTMLLL